MNQPTDPPTRYTFLELAVPDPLAAMFPDRLVLFDQRYGTHVRRCRTQQYVGLPNRRQAAAA